MDVFSNNWSISWTWINCIFSIFLTAVFAAEKPIQISAVVGSSVTLNCSNESTGNLIHVTWKTDKSTIFSYNPEGTSNVSSKGNKKMLTSESELYALVIDNVQKSDAENYTCEVNSRGLWVMAYELNVEDKVEGKGDFLLTPVLVTVPLVFFLMLILSWILFRKVCKRHENNVDATGATQDEDCVYENYLEGEKRVQAVMVTTDHSEICGNYY